MPMLNDGPDGSETGGGRRATTTSSSDWRTRLGGLLSTRLGGFGSSLSLGTSTFFSGARLHGQLGAGSETLIGLIGSVGFCGGPDPPPAPPTTAAMAFAK